LHILYSTPQIRIGQALLGKNFVYNQTVIIDISLPLNEHTVPYPGNPEIKIESQKSSTGQTIISKISLGSHSGTHIDAPSHVFAEKTIDQIPLDTFIGPCRVLDFTNSEKFISKDDLQSKDIKEGERILFKTKNSLRGFETFHDDFIFLDGEAAEYLATINPLLVGIDYLSIKQKGSSDTRAHNSLLTKNIPIVEGLNLTDTEEGEYELICLPLAFTGIDGAPARAILKTTE